jgi:hypothetical protein
MLAVAQVAGRLTRQARGQQRTHEKIVQQVDSAEVEMPPGQDPPGETDADSDGGDCYVRARDAGEFLSASCHVLELDLTASTTKEQGNPTLRSR